MYLYIYIYILIYRSIWQLDIEEEGNVLYMCILCIKIESVDNASFLVGGWYHSNCMMVSC